MRTLLMPILFVGMVGFGTAHACDDHFGTCEVEDWKYSHTMNFLTVEGVTTCDKGRIRIRMYTSGEFVGIANGFVEGHTFEAISMTVDNRPASLEIKYSIETGG